MKILQKTSNHFHNSDTTAGDVLMPFLIKVKKNSLRNFKAHPCQL